MLARHAAARAAAAAAAATARVQAPRRWASTAGAVTLPPLQLCSPTFMRLLTAKVPFVDKTSGIADLLVRDGTEAAVAARTYFARPHKFGKRLAMSTARAILAAGDLPRNVRGWKGYDEEADADRLQGTAVYDRFKRGKLGNLMKRAHFVVSLDLDDVLTGALLEEAIISQIAAIAGSAFGPELKADVLLNPTPAGALCALVAAVPRGVPVAVLVSGYDAAIMNDVAEERWCAAHSAAAELRSLAYATKTETTGPRISHFIMAGVAPFPKPCIFSGFNNFVDLTNNSRLSAAIDFTDAEIRTSFPDHLAHLAANETGGDVDAAMAELARWFGGYCFDGATTCFSPRGVLPSLACGMVDRSQRVGTSAHTLLGLRPLTALTRLAAEEQQFLDRRHRNGTAKVEAPDLAGRHVRALPTLVHTGLLSLTPSPTATAVPVPAGGGRIVVPNESARKALREVLQITISDAASTQLATALTTRDTKLFGAACKELLRAVPYDPEKINVREGATPEKVAAAKAQAQKREAEFHRLLYGALRFMGDVRGVRVIGEFNDWAGDTAVIICFSDPDATWVVEFDKSAGTIDKVEGGKEFVTVL